MAEQEHVNDDGFESALSRLRPRSAGVERDRVMYLAGRASLERTGGGRWRRASLTAAGWLLAAAFCGLWLNQPVPVVVTKVEYIERAVELRPGSPEEEPAVVETTDGGMPGSIERVSATARARREGRGTDLDVLIASRLSRAGQNRERNTSPAVRSNTSVSNRPETSYIALMKFYLESPGTDPLAGGAL